MNIAKLVRTVGLGVLGLLAAGPARSATPTATITPTATRTPTPTMTSTGTTPTPTTSTPTPPVATGGYNVLGPCRLVDTRAAYQNLAALHIGGALQAGSVRSFTVKTNGTACTAPADATAVVLNITAIAPTSTGFLTFYPHGPLPSPLVSTINYKNAVVAIANGAIVPLAAVAAGTVDADVYTANNNTGTHVDVAIDVVGYFAATGAAYHVMPAPCRLVNAVSVATHQVLALSVQDNTSNTTPGCTVPKGATAVSINLTALGATGDGGYLTAYPQEPRPSTSTVNFLSNDPPAPNGAIVPLAPWAESENDLLIYAATGATGQVKVVVDLVGYFM
jgi:hypothetical protein